MSIRARHYLQFDKNRDLKQKDKTNIWNLFIKDKKSAKEIAVLLNIHKAKVNAILFCGGKPFRNYDNRGVCAFGPKTAYWKNEKELIESFDPKYKAEDIDAKELAWFMYYSKQTEIKQSKLNGKEKTSTRRTI